MTEEHSVLREDVPREYNGRLPYRDELTRFGGYPGVKYCLVHGMNMGEYQEQGWEMADRVLVGRVKGPKGDCKNIVVMTQGKPIYGADPMNGQREWFVDPSILSETGLEGGQLTTMGASDAEEEEAEASAPAES